jgi:hypothetical protein
MPRNKKVDLGNAKDALAVIARSPCDEAIQGPRTVAPGLLRCARNDGGVDVAIIGHRISALTCLKDNLHIIVKMIDSDSVECTVTEVSVTHGSQLTMLSDYPSF